MVAALCGKLRVIAVHHATTCVMAGMICLLNALPFGGLRMCDDDQGGWTRRLFRSVIIARALA